MSRSEDTYGLLRNKREVDSDVNEDRRREELLDDSFEEWYENIGEQVKRKLDLTDVPKESVFDSAAETDEE